MRKLILLLSVAALVSGCTTRRAGTIQNGIYTSARGDFSVPVPLGIILGKNGTMKEGKDRVSFNRFYSSQLHVLCFRHNKTITDANRYDLMYEIMTRLYPDRPFIYKKNFSDVQGGMAFAVWPQGDDTLEKPRKLGIGGFWTGTRAIIIVASLPDLLDIFPEGVPQEKQIRILEEIVLDTAREIVVYDHAGK